MSASGVVVPPLNVFRLWYPVRNIQRERGGRGVMKRDIKRKRGVEAMF